MIRYYHVQRDVNDFLFRKFTIQYYNNTYVLFSSEGKELLTNGNTYQSNNLRIEPTEM